MGWNITDSKSLEEEIFKLKLKVAAFIGIQKGMTVIDIGCGQGGFTASLAKIVGEKGKVLAVDVSDEYAKEFTERLDKYGVKNRVVFIQADGTSLGDVQSAGDADVVTSFRLLEELKRCEDMPKIIGGMVRVAKDDGKVCLIELSTVARNKAEEAYIRLHKESGDCFFEQGRIVDSMKEHGLKNVYVEKFDTDIWFSPSLAKQDLSFAQVWFDPNVEKSLAPLIDKYGMKYPKLRIFSGQKSAKD
ncbi:MAG: methyltransferase domain-containing protein [Candidatus Bathyarchaeia archaeon]